ncbi:MAG: type I polyketide synthase, partial [Ilumatobacteraceae bacterium]
MSELFDRLSNLSPKRLALLAMELQERLDAEQSAHTSPIAIVGMGCRLPGAADLDAYWRLLAEGVDAIREVPESRWDVDEYYDPDPEAVGKIATRWAGTLDGIDRFEPQMFGISPREAQTMDPQQRLLLEVAWEALEHAGIAPDSVHDTQTGVYIGVCNTDYAQLLMEGDVDDFDMYLSTGNATSVASGRLSYVLGLQGPALTVDTACSSSLVAVHLAVQSLRTGGCRMALAGGANVILSPKTTMTLSRAKMMAADGRCKAFDSRADGFVRGEGCGLVVLKRLADAEADGDRILAVIRGSALNQDGRSNGLTAPNGPSQVSVIRAALADAGISPGDVSYVETHGTGTALGDPIEAQALGAVYCEQRSRIRSETAQPGERRLLIGSVKTNFGHLESAAGIAGLIKVVLSLQHREIPPMLHLVERNPYIPWDELPIDIPTVLTPWHAAGGRRIAGVSSFGFSGTNAHVLIEEAAPPAAQLDPEDVHRGDHLLKLSARTEDALAEQADRLGSRLAGAPALRIADVARTLGVGRSDLAYRLTVVTADVEAAAAALAAWSSGNEIDAVVAGGTVGQRPPDIAFLFTGHGSQRVGMGRDLYRADAAFTAAIDHCAELLGSLMDRHLIEVLFDDAAGESLLASMAYAQPALFAIEYALAEMWASWGVRPSVVAGHSIGEYVAAVVAGVMSIEDGIRLVAARGRLMASLPADGEMATVFTTEDVVGPIIAAAGGHVSIAAVNGPQSIALSATGGHLHAVLDALRGRGVEVRPLAVPVAAHSAQMDAILDEFEAVAAGVRMRAPQIDVISTMTGALAAGDDLVTPRYWRQHLRRPVRFTDAFRAMYDSGLRTFVEVGPHPTLLNMARHIVGEHECTWLPSLRSGHDDWRQMLMSAGELYTTGVHLDWRAVGGPGGHVVDLPTYPFQRERYWASPTRANSRRRDGAHPLLGRRVQSPTLHDIVYETALGATWPAFLDHHRIYGTALLPSPAYLEMALAAAAAADGGTSRHEVAGFEIREALILPEVGERIVQVVVHGVAPDRGFEVVSRLPDGDEWTLHATGHLRPLPDATHELFDLDAALARCDERIGGADYYGRLAELGLEFGSGFRGVTDVWRRDGEAVGRVVLPSALLGEAAAFNMHPALLDACFHVLGAPMVATDGGGHAYLLVGLDEFRLYRRPGSSLWNHTVLRDGFDDPGAAFSGDIRLYDDDGTLVAEALGLHLRHASSQALLRAARGTGRDWLYEVSWQPDDVRGDAGLRPSELAASLGSSIDAAAAALEGHDRLVDGLDAVAVAAIAPALRELGAPLQPGDAIDVATLAAELGVADRHRRLLARLLELLAERGMVRATPVGWQVIATDSSVEVDTARLRIAFPDAQTEIALVERCASALPAVLRDDVDAL